MSDTSLNVLVAGVSGLGCHGTLQAPDVVVGNVGNQKFVSGRVDGDVMWTKRVGGSKITHVSRRQNHTRCSC